MSKYVSRGAYKLEGFLRCSGLDLKGSVVLDAGSSHGGFTQAALMAGARRVYALDVGKGVLDWGLRRLPEVTVMEGVNARHITSEFFEEPPDTAFIDLSFISLKKVLPAVFSVTGKHVAALLKPQFEAGYRETSKGKGVINDPEVHKRVLREVREYVSNPDWEYIGSYPSRVKGRKGNREFFIYYRRRVIRPE